MSEDIAAIKQTLASYCHRVDRGTADEVAALFAETAVLYPRYDGDYQVEGWSNIQKWYAFYHDNFRANIRHLKHLIHSMEIEVDGNEASSVCYLSAYFVSNDDNQSYLAQGTYHDELVRGNERWLFQTRRIEVEFVTALGDAVEQMTPLGFPGAN